MDEWVCEVLAGGVSEKAVLAGAGLTSWSPLLTLCNTITIRRARRRVGVHLQSDEKRYMHSLKRYMSSASVGIVVCIATRQPAGRLVIATGAPSPTSDGLAAARGADPARLTAAAWHTATLLAWWIVLEWTSIPEMAVVDLRGPWTVAPWPGCAGDGDDDRRFTVRAEEGKEPGVLPRLSGLSTGHCDGGQRAEAELHALADTLRCMRCCTALSSTMLFGACCRSASLTHRHDAATAPNHANCQSVQISAIGMDKSCFLLRCEIAPTSHRAALLDAPCAPRTTTTTALEACTRAR